VAHPFCVRIVYNEIEHTEGWLLIQHLEKGEVTMSFKLSNIKWGWVVLGIVLTVVIAIVVPIVINVGYGVVLGFQLRGSPPPERIEEFARSTPVAIVGVLVMAVSALIGGRVAARHAEAGQQLNGLVVGIGTVVVWLVLGLFTGGIGLWGLLSCVAAIVGGWLGGLLAARRAQPEF
jgi:hypothetical protein